MKQDEIIEMARQAGMEVHSSKGQIRIGSAVFTGEDTTKQVVAFAKLVAAKERERYMQLFLDPENQPTQFGTATQEYREKEVKEVQDLLTELAHHVRTKHLYGMEVQKMLEKEAAIRARGEA